MEGRHMERIGQGAAAKAVSPLSSSTKSTAVEPVMVALEADVEIPIRVRAPWVSSDGRRCLRRALTESEREILKRRHADLSLALDPYEPHEHPDVRKALAAMMAGFRATPAPREELEAVLGLLCNMLRSYPLWVIRETCRRIAMGTAEIDCRFAPNDAQVVALAAQIAQPYRALCRQSFEMLAAPVEGAADERSRSRRFVAPTTMDGIGAGDIDWSATPPR